MIVEVPNSLVFNGCEAIRISDETVAALARFAARDDITLSEAAESALSVGLDFHESSAWGAMLAEYWAENGSFSWSDFLDFARLEFFNGR